MPHNEIINLIDDRIKLELEELKIQRKKEIEILYSGIRRGPGISSTPGLSKIKTFCSQEIKKTVEKISLVIERFIKDSNEENTDKLSNELKNIAKENLHKHIGNYKEWLPRDMKIAAPNTTIGSQISGAELEIKNDRDRGVKKIYSEIDISMRSLENKEEVEIKEGEIVSKKSKTNWTAIIGSLAALIAAVAGLWGVMSPKQNEKVIIYGKPSDINKQRELEEKNKRLKAEKIAAEARVREIEAKQKSKDLERKNQQEKLKNKERIGKLEAEKKAAEVQRLEDMRKKKANEPKIIARDGNFIAYDTGVVYDEYTGLEWYAGPDRNKNWYEAKKWIKKLLIAGGDWRMPTNEELESLYEKGASERNMTPLLKITGWYVWSVASRFSFKGSRGLGVLRRRRSKEHRVFAVRSKMR